MKRYTLIEALSIIGEGCPVPVERLPIPSINLGAVFNGAQLREFQAKIAMATSPISSLDYLRDKMRELLPQINEKTGQENDADYWAYAVYYALTRLSLRI